MVKVNGAVLLLSQLGLFLIRLSGSDSRRARCVELVGFHRDHRGRSAIAFWFRIDQNWVYVTTWCLAIPLYGCLYANGGKKNRTIARPFDMRTL